ncbi:hypothetical protein ABG768_019006 [Culter alburnus]|uniref:Helicase ATP-binding domain-containing protein n=1 Tax=Culter alburnus TaxID=194366 RepID=A0AAW2AX24_CULAL
MGNETRDAIRSVMENIQLFFKLKPEHEECLINILNGGDVVALLLNGFGKSLIYQLLPLVSEKLGRPKAGKAIVVIVSPLVALMEDQVKEAEKLGLCAAQLGVHNDQDIMVGYYSLIFGSPESWILNPKWRAMLASTLYQDNLVAMVVDEAHVAYKW